MEVGETAEIWEEQSEIAGPFEGESLQGLGSSQNSMLN